MNYKHPSQIERHQIHSFKKAQQNITQIARLLGRDKSTISRELRCNAVCRGYRAKQACELTCKRYESSRNASTLAPWVKEQARELLRLQWSPEQIAGKLPVRRESLYLHVYSEKAHGGTLCKNLRCQKKKQKQKRKRYANGRDLRGQIPNRRLLSERPAHMDKRLQEGHRECDTVLGAAHKQAIVTVLERKSGYVVMAKVSNKTSDLVGSTINQALKSFDARVKTLTYDNGKEFSRHAEIDKTRGSNVYFARPFTSWERGTNENFNGLMRQYVPEKRQLANLTGEELQMIENRMNKGSLLMRATKAPANDRTRQALLGMYP